MKYIEHCNDCGKEFTETKGSRRDVCSECWDNRGWLLHNVQKIGMANIKACQRSMAAGRGTAKKRIEALKKQFIGGPMTPTLQIEFTIPICRVCLHRHNSWFKEADGQFICDWCLNGIPCPGEENEQT